MGGIRSKAAAVTTALALCGCSFVTVRRPPSSPPPPGAPLECTQSGLAPRLDTTGAIVTPVVGLATWFFCATFLESTQSWASDPKDLHCGAVLGATIGITAAYAGSAVYGFHETRECRRLASRAAPPELHSARRLPAHLSPAPRTDAGGTPGPGRP